MIIHVVSQFRFQSHDSQKPTSWHCNQSTKNILEGKRECIIALILFHNQYTASSAPVLLIPAWKHVEDWTPRIPEKLIVFQTATSRERKKILVHLKHSPSSSFNCSKASPFVSFQKLEKIYLQGQVNRQHAAKILYSPIRLFV